MQYYNRKLPIFLSVLLQLLYFRIIQDVDKFTQPKTDADPTLVSLLLQGSW